MSRFSSQVLYRCGSFEYRKSDQSPSAMGIDELLRELGKTNVIGVSLKTIAEYLPTRKAKGVRKQFNKVRAYGNSVMKVLEDVTLGEWYDYVLGRPLREDEMCDELLEKMMEMAEQSLGVFKALSRSLVEHASVFKDDPNKSGDDLVSYEEEKEAMDRMIHKGYFMMKHHVLSRFVEKVMSVA